MNDFIFRNTGKVFFSVFLALILAACSDSLPAVVATHAAVVFDYSDSNAYPSMRLSLFAQPSSDVDRVLELRALSIVDGTEWVIPNPRIIEVKGKYWAGCTRLMPQNKEIIKQGAYTLVYEDSAGRAVDASFSVTYPERLLTTRADSVKSALGSSCITNIALYDSGGELVYYGTVKKSDKTGDDLKKKAVGAVLYRICYSIQNNSFVCLMPSKDVGLFNQENLN